MYFVFLKCSPCLSDKYFLQSTILNGKYTEINSFKLRIGSLNVHSLFTPGSKQKEQSVVKWLYRLTNTLYFRVFHALQFNSL